METTDELVRDVIAREAIRDLSARYCDYIWRSDLDGLVSLFTEDGRFVVEGNEVEAISCGRAQLRKVYEQAIAEMNPRLFIHNHVIDLLGGNRARGRCYVEVYSAKLSMQRVGSGYYEDEYAKIGTRLVRVQLRAMGCEHFDLGVRRADGEMILRERQGGRVIEQAIKWLRHENAKGAHIYIRPAGTHGLSLIDDLSAEAIARMKAEGFEPAVVVETSPTNFQAWLNHGRMLDAPMSTRAAKALAERFGGDLSSADWRHFGRLAGFTNPKPERQLPSGQRPFARLRSATGRVYSKAAELLEAVAVSTEHATAPAKAPPRRWHRRRAGIKPLDEFHADATYGGDLHRADMAWAKHAAGRGLTVEQIKDELLESRDLSKKGDHKRQLAYAVRTAEKALRSL